MNVDSQGLILAGTCLFAGVGVFLIARDIVRCWRDVPAPLRSQAPTPDVDEWAHGWDSGVVEADELMDAFITDQHRAELDAWIGTTPVLPDTPSVVQALGNRAR